MNTPSKGNSHFTANVGPYIIIRTALCTWVRLRFFGIKAYNYIVNRLMGRRKDSISCNNDSKRSYSRISLKVTIKTNLEEKNAN
jgi:hypothetical protein